MKNKNFFAQNGEKKKKKLNNWKQKLQKSKRKRKSWKQKWLDLKSTVMVKNVGQYS